MFVASHAAAQLVHVGQAVAVGLVDEDRVGVGNIQSAFDDRRGEQNVVAVGDEVEHDFFEFRFRHLPMADANARLGDDLAQFVGHGLDVVDAVMHEEDLPVAVQFAQHRVTNQLVVEPGHARLDRQTIVRRRFEVRNIAHPSSDRCRVRGIGVAVIVSTSTTAASP